MEIPRKRSVSPVRSQLVPPDDDDDDSSTIPGEGQDAFEVAIGEDSKVVMTIDDMDIPRKLSKSSPVRSRPPTAGPGTMVGEDSKMPMTVDKMEIPRKPSTMARTRSRSPQQQQIMTVDDMDIPRKPSTKARTRSRSPQQPMTIDNMDIPRKPSSIPTKIRSTSPRLARSPPRELPRELEHDDSSTLPDIPDDTDITTRRSANSKYSTSPTTKRNGTNPRRPLEPPPQPPELKDDDSSTLPDDEAPIDDTGVPSKPTPGSKIRGSGPTKKRGVGQPKRGFLTNRSRTPPKQQITLSGEGDDTFEVAKADDTFKSMTDKNADSEIVSFSLAGGPLFRRSSRKLMDKYHDIAHDDVSELDESNSAMDWMSEELRNFPAIRGNNTGLSAQATTLRRSQQKEVDGDVVGEEAEPSDDAEATPEKKRIFKLGGNRGKKGTSRKGPDSRDVSGNGGFLDESDDGFNLVPMSPELLSPDTRRTARRKQPEDGDDSSTLGGIGDTLEAAKPNPKNPRALNLRGKRRVSLLSRLGKSKKDMSQMGDSSSDDFDEAETDEFDVAPISAKALARRRRQLENGDDSSTIGGEGDTFEPVVAKPKRGLSKMVSFTLGGAMNMITPRRNKKTVRGNQEGVSDDEISVEDGGMGTKASFVSHSGVNMAGGIGVGGMVPPSPLQVGRRRKHRRRVNKRGGMVTTPSSVNIGEVLSNPFSTDDTETVERGLRRGSISSVLSNSELSQETDLHRALADDESTLDQLKFLLENEPASASIHDKEGKLPLHIVAENEQLHLNLGGALDDFILEDLINRNRRALITPNYAGDFPFVAAIREWVDNINEVAEVNIPDFTSAAFSTETPIIRKESKSPGKRKMSLLGGLKRTQEAESDGSSELGLGGPAANDVESQRMKQEVMRDLAEHLIPWNVFIDDLALWSIDMLSMLIEREPLKAMWTIKIVDVVAGIPCFLKTVLLIDDDDQRKHVLQSRLLHEVMLHEKSMGPWLVYLITSDDEVAQDRAVMYLQLMTVVENQVMKASRKTFSSRISGAFQTADNKFLERKDKVYAKAAQLPGIIPAFMQFNTDNFSRCSTTSIVQFILDKKLFEPKSLAVILFDVFFLTMAVVLYTLCSNEVFKLISNMRYTPMRVFAVNQTAYDMCESGTLIGYDLSCNYYNKRLAYSKPFNLGTISLFRPTFDCDMECQVCRGISDFVGDESTGSSIVSYTGEQAISEESIFTCYPIGDRYAIDTFLIFCVMSLTFNCLYFMSRSLAAWWRVPRKYLAAQFFFFFTLVDTLSIMFPVVMVGLFITFIYQTDKFTKSNEGIYVPLKMYDVWMQEAELLSAFSAACVGLLYLKILMYFKVLNQYTATFIFALGEVVKDIFWFFWIMVVITFGFSQMFYTTLSCKEGFCRGDIGQLESKYNHFTDSLLITYSILLGDFDLDQYNSPFTTIIFVLYTFAIVIIVLNFLIAIVGDSFDKSMVKIETHFGRARLMFMVELSAFQSIAKVPFRVKKRNYRRFLIGGNWKGCIIYLLLSAGAVAGFILVAINKDLVTNSSIVVLSMIGTTLALMILSPFIWKMGLVGFLVHSPLMTPVRGLVGQLLILFFRIILGKSILSDRSEKEQKDWGGRMKHIVAAIDEKIRESEALTLNTIAENDEKQNRIIEKMELRMENLEEDVSDMKKMLIKIQSMLEERQ